MKGNTEVERLVSEAHGVSQARWGWGGGRGRQRGWQPREASLTDGNRRVMEADRGRRPRTG